MKGISLIEKSALGFEYEEDELTNKIDLLLVYAGVKRAATFDYFNGSFNLAYCLDLFRILRLNYCVEMPNKWVNGDELIYEFGVHVVKDYYWMGFVKSDNPILVGRAYNYPETSIEAFVGQLPKADFEITDDPVLDFFCDFTFSEYYYKHELKTPMYWMSMLRKLSPLLLSRLKKRRS